MRAADQVFLVLLTRIAQVAVHIDEARGNHLARRLDHVRILRREILADGGHLAALNQQIADHVHTVGRVDHAAAADERLVINRKQQAWPSFLVSM